MALNFFDSLEDVHLPFRKHNNTDKSKYQEMSILLHDSKISKHYRQRDNLKCSQRKGEVHKNW